MGGCCSTNNFSIETDTPFYKLCVLSNQVNGSTTHEQSNPRASYQNIIRDSSRPKLNSDVDTSPLNSEYQTANSQDYPFTNRNIQTLMNATSITLNLWERIETFDNSLESNKHARIFYGGCDILVINLNYSYDSQRTVDNIYTSILKELQFAQVMNPEIVRSPVFVIIKEKPCYSDAPTDPEANKLLLKDKINEFCDENELYCVFNDNDDDFDTLIKCFSSKCFESGLRTKGGRGNYVSMNPQSDYEKYNFNPSINQEFGGSFEQTYRNSKRVNDNTNMSDIQNGSEFGRTVTNNLESTNGGLTRGIEPQGIPQAEEERILEDPSLSFYSINQDKYGL